MRLGFAGLALLTILICRKSVAIAQCYFPNGTGYSDGFVCSPHAEFSACCGQGDECTTNGLCMPASGGGLNWYWREGCTDPTWESDSCPKYCYNGATGPTASSINHLVLACTADTYCCTYEGETYSSGHNSFDCCDDSLRAFNAGPAKYLAGTSIITAVFSTTASSSASTAFVTVTATPSANPQNATASTTPSSSASPDDAPLSTGAKAGIGIGAAVGGLALMALGIFIGPCMKRRNAASQEPASPNCGEMAEQALYPKADYKPPVYPVEASWQNGVNEAHGWMPTEADSNVIRAELDGNWRTSRNASKSNVSS